MRFGSRPMSRCSSSMVAPTRDSTLFRVGDPGGQGNLILAHTGAIATPGRVLRILNFSHDVLAEIEVTGLRTSIAIYLTDLDEPDEIFVSVDQDEQSVRSASATAS